eukprot:Platyproteum_vivax@DN5077_c0_g1_i1.p1
MQILLFLLFAAFLLAANADECTQVQNDLTGCQKKLASAKESGEQFKKTSEKAGEKVKVCEGDLAEAKKAAKAAQSSDKLTDRVYGVASGLASLYYNLGCMTVHYMHAGFSKLVALVNAQNHVDAAYNVIHPPIAQAWQTVSDQYAGMKGAIDATLAPIGSILKVEWDMLNSSYIALFKSYIQPTLKSFIKAHPQHEKFLPTDDGHDWLLFVALASVAVGHMFMIASSICKMCTCCRRNKKSNRKTNNRTKGASSGESIPTKADSNKAKQSKKNR